MASKKISELISGSSNPPLSGVIAVVYSGETYQQRLSTLREILVDSGSHIFTGVQIAPQLILTGGTGNDLIVTGSALFSNGSITASYFVGDGSRLTNLPSIDMGSYATTGSNIFVDDQIISGSLNVSGSIIVQDTGSLFPDLTIQGTISIQGTGSLNNENLLSSNTIQRIETITSAAYVSLNPPISGTLYIIID